MREKYFTNQEKEAKEALKRIASGDFALSEAIEWEEIEKSLEKVYKDETD